MHFLLRCTQFVRHTSAKQFFFRFSHQQTVAKQQRQQRMVAMISQCSDHVEETEEKRRERDGRREMRKWKNTKTKFICTTKITKMDSRVFVFIQSQRELEFHKLHSRSKFDVCFYFATVCTVNVRRLLITSHSRISTSVEREWVKMWRKNVIESCKMAWVGEVRRRAVYKLMHSVRRRSYCVEKLFFVWGQGKQILIG